MCIRDSFLPSWGVESTVVPCGDIAAIEAAIQPNTRMIYTCLLYTSDAADERSSVDLGGRRIIKKKKPKISH